MSSFNWTKLNERMAIADLESSLEGQTLYLKKISIGDSAKIDFTLVLLHDYCFHHGEYNNLISYFESKNINANIFLLDLVGHGQSSGTRCYVDTFKQYVDDCFNLFKNIIEDKKGKLLLIGNGLGGSILLDFYSRLNPEEIKKIDGLILSNFLFNIKLGSNQFNLNKIINFNIFKKTRFLKYLDPRVLTSDQNEILKRLHDPLFVSNPPIYGIQLLNENSKRVYHDAYFLEVPVLVLVGEKSSLISNSLIRYFKKGIKKDLLTEKTYSHMKHDLYNERDKELIFDEIINWMIKL